MSLDVPNEKYTGEELVDIRPPAFSAETRTEVSLFPDLNQENITWLLNSCGVCLMLNF